MSQLGSFSNCHTYAVEILAEDSWSSLPSEMTQSIPLTDVEEPFSSLSTIKRSGKQHVCARELGSFPLSWLCRASEDLVAGQTSPTHATNRRSKHDQANLSIACSHLLLRQVV